ncbi:OmpA family protein [Methylosinus sp. H3A]|uniref:OmpA family protein n=1 Tax=Methylosinus sp. H3A TaxID=2785786 RepID=UPI0018C3333E|nr:OmpA family protein [Methylosinus sp. H3A]MBG0809769.1 OmpA family protein [Methylosinus sp. H3A]
MFRPTGPGKVEIDQFFSGAGMLKALLYNFDFDDFDKRKFRPLKTEHQKFLSERVVPLLERNRGFVWMTGSASRIGSNDWNMETAMVRVGTVQAFLLDHGVDGNQIEPNAVGEEEAQTHALDDERDRGVRLWIMPKLEDDPRPPKKVPPRPKVSRKFRIAMVTAISASHASRLAKFSRFKLGGGPLVDFAVFTVWDMTNNIACMYAYVGLGLGVGLPSLPSGSVTTHGPWNDFTTEKPMAVWQFGRWSRFTTAGAGSHSVNWITIETPRGIDNVYEKIDTGVTYGVGMSSSVGDFIRAAPPERFSGP